MSRAYRISVSESVNTHVRVEDGFQTRLELLAVLPAEQMAELLAAELEPLGYERDGERMRRADPDGIEIAIDLTAGTVTARLAAGKDVALTIERSRQVAEERVKKGREELRQAVVAELGREVDAERQRLTAEVSGKLEARLRDLRQELDRATNRATAAALKIRAAQLGEIQEVSEDPETGELTIRVKV